MVADIVFMQEFFYGTIQQIMTIFMFLSSEVSDFLFCTSVGTLLQSFARVIGNFQFPIATLTLRTRVLTSTGFRRKSFILTPGIENSKSLTSNADMNTTFASGLIPLIFAASSKPLIRGILTSVITNP